jgi:hypothetical protein
LSDVEIKPLAFRPKAHDPDPPDGAVSVVSPLFRWSAGSSAQFHNVYLGTSPDLGTTTLVGAHLPAAVYVQAAGLTPGVKYYWRVDETEKDGVTTYTGDVWSFTTQGLTAYLPQPADGTVDASPTPTLSWQPGQAATKHHVYFSDSLDAVKQRAASADKGTLAEATFTPGALETLTTYYWTVDEVTFSGTRAGPVWTFTTYLPVDDFESYTDEVGQEIFSTWIDGYADKSNGSMVGYLDAPFTEQTIVHSGAHSMPMEYNDVKSPNFSAAHRIFSPPVDWTVNGADRLVIFLRGKTSNTPAQLYVTVADAAGHSAWAIPNDDTMVTTPKWNEWRIPIELYTVLGVDMARVERITIGVYDLEKSPGATGTLYLDDIRVIRSAAAQ